MRRTKDTKLNGVPIISLPIKIFNTENVLLEADERLNYDNIKNDIADEFNSLRQMGVNMNSREMRFKVLAKIMLLKQIASHRALSSKARLSNEFI